jgi:hypothetical protein
MQYELMHESFNDALREVVQALGGTKKVGEMLRPEKLVVEASRWVADCLNSDRREKFNPDQVLYLMREGRKAGCHAAMRFLAADCGYEMPRSITDEVQFVEALDDLHALQAALTKTAEKVERLARDNPSLLKMPRRSC